ncbi:alpha/beta hydrolase [Pseudomonas sp. PDM24]|uniref:alpha/beta hydrolase n=1 Tax=Pseudomonas sp. PDM24 TaxID=2854777 RepID=UPI001C48895E|nr:alpha/beta hydrolase [Pseudomonas sp. PDM24]MBV7495065.1 alpha/beta hydrolase [Pseudomonas sp. PDM24]
MPLDSHSAALAELFAKARVTPLNEMTALQVREGASKLRAMYGQGPEMGNVHDVLVHSGGATIEARLLVPRATPKALMVYFHGGGWVTGHIDDFDTLGRKLAERTGCAVLLVNYRLAPEARFPAAIDDGMNALQWAAAQGRELLGSDSLLPLIVAGDSAGGNIAAVVTRRARDKGQPHIAAQVLLYPVTDADFERPSYLDPNLQPLLTGEMMRWYWDHYLPDAAQRQHPDASPLQVNDVRGLPPTLLITAEYDPLRDEGEAYAARLVDAGVPMQFERYPGQFHGFVSFVNVLPGSAAAIEHIGRFIDHRLAR